MKSLKKFNKFDKVHNVLYPAAALILLFILLYFVYRQSVTAAVLLGIELIGIGVWGFLSAPKIWLGYKQSYKKLSPAEKRNVAKPDKLYYKINRYIIFPLLAFSGVMSLYLAYLINKY